MNSDSTAPKAFISYSHDSQEHKDIILQLAKRLRFEGVECNIDQFEEFPGEGWSWWMMNQLEWADFVVVVCTEQYYRQFQGQEESDIGRGVIWEGAIISKVLHDSHVKSTQFIPVIFSPEDENFIPIMIRGLSQYNLSTEKGYQAFYRHLTNQPIRLKPPLSEKVELAPHVLPPCERKLEDLTRLSVNPTTSLEQKLEYQIEQQIWYAHNLPETQEIDENECKSLKNHIDVVIITATDVELRAVTKLLKPYPNREKVLLVYSGSETYYLGNFGAYITVVTKCRMGAISEGSVILATEQAQRLWCPRAIIMVGIAFGKDPNKQKIGDVLVASQIISYEQQRIEDEKIIYRGSIPPSNTILLNRFENTQNWQFARPDGLYCNLIIGPVLSGEKLLDNPDFKASLFKQFPQAVGGEMEGAGLCAASGRVGAAWILVKSICDWADGKKDKKHQALAAAAAADLVNHVLSQKTVLNGIKKQRAYTLPLHDY